MAIRLKKEGHSVRVFVADENQRQNLEGLVEKTDDWKNELDWVGKGGLIIFDTIGYGKEQDDLREKGFSVVGGSAVGDKLENSRQFGQKILSLYGINTVPSVNFCNVEEAIEFVKKNKGPWVIKQNGHVDKTFNYVGHSEDNRDVESVLKSYFKNNQKDCNSIDLQKRIDGIEIGVGRYFNGTDWVGPIEMNVEHKNLCNGGLGPKTYEMGTLMWYDSNENNRFFKELLDKIKPVLIDGNFRGDIDINCIVNEEGIFPLEFTARFGFPALQLQSELHESPWGEFLKAVADGKPYDLKYKSGYGIVVLVAAPPFPYEAVGEKNSSLGMEVCFTDDFTEEDFSNVHLGEVSLRKEDGRDIYYISSQSGFVLHVTGSGRTIEEARSATCDRVKKIIIPKMFYRTDIGVKFLEEEKAKLEKWGWL